MSRRIALLFPLLAACAGPGNGPDSGATASPASTSEATPLATRAAQPAVDAQEAFLRLAKLDPLGAAEGYASLLRAAAEQLAAADAGDQAQLADEVEFLALRLAAICRQFDKRYPAQLLHGVSIDPQHGMAWARVEQVRTMDCGATLGMLQDWSLIGPFDNERGGGMRTALAPEAAPGQDLLHDGRVREVGWRPLPASNYPDGRLPLGALLVPDRQSAMFVRTWVRADSPTDAMLLLGVQGELRAWANGAPILDAYEDHDLAADGLAAAVQLQTGWNEIVVKVGSRDRVAVLQARLVVEGSAAPLHLPAVAEPPPGVEPAMLSADAGPTPDYAAHPGALGSALRTGAADAESLYRRSQLESSYEAGTRAEYPGRIAARDAVAAAPEELRYRIHAARMLEARGEVSAELDLNPWLHEVQAILERDPQQPVALVMLLQQAVRWQMSQARALDVLDRLTLAAPDNLTTAILRAWAYDSMELGSLGDAEWHVIAKHPDLAWFPSYLITAANRIYQYGSSEQDTMLRAAAAGEYGTEALELLIASERRRMSTTDPRFERKSLDALFAKRPWNASFLHRTARRLLAVGELEAADALLDEAAALSPEDPVTYRIRARVALAGDDRDAAVRALEQVLVFDFSADDERRLLEYLRASGAGSFEENWFEPLEDVVARYPVRPVEGESTGHEVLLYRTVVRVKPDGTTSTYTRKVSRVLNRNGVRELDRESFYYSWQDQDLRLLTAAVLRTDGSREESATGRGWRGSSVDLPPLEPGDIVDLEWRVDDLRTGIFGNYVGIDHAMTPNRGVPVRHSELVLLVPEELPLQFHTIAMNGAVGIAEDRGELGTAYAWSTDDIEPTRPESGMPASFESVARVQASSYADWQAFGTWWWNLIDESITASPEMQAKVVELTAGKESKAEKLRAIYDFVVTDIRYQAWEFGVHGYQPYSAPVIFSRGFGDCKDKAILLKSLLAEVDIVAHPVVINRSGTAQLGGLRSEEDHTLALISHFNHAIAYLPAQDGLQEMWLDGTARLHPLEVLPYDDRGAKVLVVDEGDAENRRIPFLTEDDDVERRVVRIAVDPEGSADVEYIVRPTGRFDPQYRYGFAGGDEERDQRAEQLASSLFGPFDGEVTSVLPNVEDLSAEVEYRFTGHARSVARSLEEGLEVPSAIDPLNLLQGPASETERQHDLLFQGPYRRETEIEFTDLAAWDAGQLPDPVRLENQDAAYSWKVTRDGDTLRIEESFELRTHRIPAERYADFRTLCRTVDEIQDSFLLLTPKP